MGYFEQWSLACALAFPFLVVVPMVLLIGIKAQRNALQSDMRKYVAMRATQGNRIRR